MLIFIPKTHDRLVSGIDMERRIRLQPTDGSARAQSRRPGYRLQQD